jgi:hypothetical protein
VSLLTKPSARAYTKKPMNSPPRAERFIADRVVETKRRMGEILGRARL